MTSKTVPDLVGSRYSKLQVTSSKVAAAITSDDASRLIRLQPPPEQPEESLGGAGLFTDAPPSPPRCELKHFALPLARKLVKPELRVHGSTSSGEARPLPRCAD